MSASGIPDIKTMFEPGVDGFVHVVPPYCYRCPLEKSYPECDVTCAKLIEQTIKWEGPETVAAVIVDPIMVTAGILPPPREYFQILRDICDRHNVLLIFDEMIVGFGRLGKMFAAQFYEVTPDIIAVGKGMSGGYSPASGIIIRDKVAQAFWGAPEENKQFMQAHTYDNNALSSTACIANIQQMLDGNMVENAAEMGAYLRKKLETLYEYPIVGDVRGEGLLYGIELVRDQETREPFDSPASPGMRVGRLAQERGLITRMDTHFVGLGPPLCITRPEVDEMFETTRSAIADASKELLG